MNMRTFHKYKDSWVGIWRVLGSTDANGSFVPPVSFKEAKEMSRKEFEIYTELDNLLSIRQRELSDKK